MLSPKRGDLQVIEVSVRRSIAVSNIDFHIRNHGLLRGHRNEPIILCGGEFVRAACDIRQRFDLL